MLRREPEAALLAEILEEEGGAMAGLGGRVLLERDPVTELLSARTEFLELGLDVLIGRLDRGGGGGMLEWLRTWIIN